MFDLCACACVHTQVLLALEGVDPNAPNAQGDSPLAAAASRGHAQVCVATTLCFVLLCFSWTAPQAYFVLL